MNNLAGKASEKDRESLQMLAESVHVAAELGDTQRARALTWAAMSRAASEARELKIPRPSSWEEDTDPVFTALFTAVHCYINLVFQQNIKDDAENKATFLYVIATESKEFTKVGITNNLTKRLSTLQVGHSEVLSIAASFKLPNRESALKLESAIHQRLARYPRRGEWFECSPLVPRMEIDQYLRGVEFNRDDIRDMYG